MSRRRLNRGCSYIGLHVAQAVTKYNCHREWRNSIGPYPETSHEAVGVTQAWTVDRWSWKSHK